MDEEEMSKFKEPDRLDNLEKDLYRPNRAEQDTRSVYNFPKLEKKEPDNTVPKSFWPTYKTKSGLKILPSISSTLKMKFLKQVLFLSILLFLGSIAVFFYVLFGNRNVVSSQNIILEVVAPTEVSGGEQLDFYINIENQNNVSIKDSDLVINFPDGVVFIDQFGKPQKRIRENVGQIPISGLVTRKYQATFFGEEGSIKTLDVNLEYSIENSNALVTKNLRYDLLVKSSPVLVSVIGPAEVTSGTNATYEIIIKSNSENTIENLAMNLSASFGFDLVSFDPEPTFGNDYFELGDLLPDKEKKIILQSQFTGFEGDQKILMVSVGAGREVVGGGLGIVFIEKQIAVNITKPFLSTSFVVNGSYAEEPVINPKQNVNVEIIIKNNLNQSLEDIEVKARVLGNLHNETTISPLLGFYQSLDKTILWNQKTTKDLASLPAGGTLRLNFNFYLKDGVDFGFNKDFDLDLNVSALKERSGFGLERVYVSEDKTIRLASSANFSASTLYAGGPFGSMGVLPPKVNEETFYTVNFKVGGSSNDLTNTSVRAVLPVYVRWTSEISPFGADIRYSPIDNSLVWDAGDIKAGEEKEVYFRIAIIPSLSQVGRDPVLVRSISAEVTDVFSGAKQNLSSINLTTKAVDVDRANYNVVN